ncbi:hypothetical protein STRDD13_01313 [Streptococcus sp. DD13]|nr:hypothetical protein STRDD13_01313 [Streptococcus sp. DD13]
MSNGPGSFWLPLKLLGSLVLAGIGRNGESRISREAKESNREQIDVYFLVFYVSA